MPRIIDTRQQRALRLWKLVEQGPAFSHVMGSPGAGDLSYDTPITAYRRWARSWVLPLLKQLVPELKNRELEE